MQKHLNGRVKKIFLLFLLLLLATRYSLLAFSAIQVPGDLKDINNTSKAWLSSQNFPITFYSKDTNLSLAFNASMKVLSNTKEIAILLTIDKAIKLNPQINNSFTFMAGFSEHNVITLKQYPITNIGITTKHTISTIKKEDFIENNESILQEDATACKTISAKYAYKSIDEVKSPLPNDKNETFNIGMKDEQIYLTKSITPNQPMLNIAFKVLFGDVNSTITYQTKWIKIEFFQNDSKVSSQDNFLSYDIKNGKNIFIQNCIACHRYNDDTTAPAKVAPMLTNIGGWINKEYLKDILLHPQNHQTAKYKNLITQGKIMPMPSFDWLSKKDFNDLLYFLQSLKASH